MAISGAVRITATVRADIHNGVRFFDKAGKRLKTAAEVLRFMSVTGEEPRADASDRVERTTAAEIIAQMSALAGEKMPSTIPSKYRQACRILAAEPDRPAVEVLSERLKMIPRGATRMFNSMVRHGLLFKNGRLSVLGQAEGAKEPGKGGRRKKTGRGAKNGTPPELPRHRVPALSRPAPVTATLYEPRTPFDNDLEHLLLIEQTKSTLQGQINALQQQIDHWDMQARAIRARMGGR